jgi:hypothetical protein
MNIGCNFLKVWFDSCGLYAPISDVEMSRKNEFLSCVFSSDLMSYDFFKKSQ